MPIIREDVLERDLTTFDLFTPWDFWVEVTSGGYRKVTITFGGVTVWTELVNDDAEYWGANQQALETACDALGHKLAQLLGEEGNDE